MLILELEEKRSSALKYSKRAKHLQRENTRLKEELDNIMSTNGTIYIPYDVPNDNVEGVNLDRLQEMERERNEAAQHLLQKARDLANHSPTRRGSPVKERPNNATLRMQDLNTSVGQAPGFDHIEKLHQDVLGQFRDVSFLLHYLL